MNEFRRIAGKEMEELVYEGSKKYHQKLMGLAKTKENEILQILMEHHSSITDDEEIKGMLKKSLSPQPLFLYLHMKVSLYCIINMLNSFVQIVIFEPSFG